MSNGENIPPPPNTYQQYNQPPPPPKSHTGAIIAVIVVVIVIIATLGFIVIYPSLNGDRGGNEPEEYSATVTVTIHNTWTTTRDYAVFVDGDRYLGASIGAGDSITHTITVNWLDYFEGVQWDGAYECTIYVNSGDSYPFDVRLADGQTQSISATLEP